MLVKIKSVAFYGLDVLDVDVEVNIANRGLPCFDIVGLPNKSIDESKQRIRSAFQNSGVEFPNKKITVNLAPADVHKEGSFYDLPIAVGIYCALNNFEVTNKLLFFGELSLDGSLRYTKGVFLAVLHALEAHYTGVCIPKGSLYEAAYFRSLVNVFVPDNLAVVFEHLSGLRVMPIISEDITNNNIKASENVSQASFQEIIGQDSAKRALTISAAGGHHILLLGPPGVGKTLLASTMSTLLPDLTGAEAVEVTKIYSVAGKLPEGNMLLTQRPFRNPHHTISYTGMVGGGHIPLPGEITLAHRGVLFLDEFSEFPKNVIEVLRQPLEVGSITITRSKGSITFPSRFILVTAANPCKCGYYGDVTGRCICSPSEIRNYKVKLSGPVMDRLDLIVHLKNISSGLLHKYLENTSKCTSWETLKDQVRSAREIQSKRFHGTSVFCNSEMSNREVKTFCNLSSSAEDLLVKSSAILNISTRAGFKLIKTARTVADLSCEKDINITHMAEAIQYRAFDKSS